MENRKENKLQLLRKQQKTNQINTIFTVIKVDAENSVTQQFSNPNNDNANSICAAESASKSENTLSESVEQNYQRVLCNRETVVRSLLMYSQDSN